MTLRHRGTWNIDTVNGFNGLEEIRLKIGYKGNMGKGYVEELTEVSTKHLYTSEPCPSESKYLRRLSGPDRHYHLSGDTGRSSFLNTPEFVQYAHKEKGLGGRLGDYAWAEEHGLPFQG